MELIAGHRYFIPRIDNMTEGIFTGMYDNNRNPIFMMKHGDNVSVKIEDIEERNSNDKRAENR